MLSAEDKKNTEQYRAPGGILNVGWIAGFMRHVKPGARMFYIQQTNNENLMLPIHLKEGDYIPPHFEEFSPVRVICHVEGRISADGKEREAKMTAISFDVATVLDMPAASGFDKIPPRGAPITEGFEFKPFTGRDERISDSSNRVRIAGWVQSVTMAPHEPGEPSDCCVMLIRQKADENTCIPVRYYNKRLAETVFDRLSRGAPVQIMGKFRMRVKKIGEPDPVTGLEPTVKYPYLHCDDAPGIVTSREILTIPPWAVEMMMDFEAVRERRRRKA